MSNQNLTTWDRFAAIYLTPSGYAIALFVMREDRLGKTIELIDINESSRVSTNDICKKLGEYSRAEYMFRQEVLETGVLELSRNRISPVLINGGDTIAKEIGRNYPVMKQDRAGFVDLASNINDGILRIDPGLEKEVKRQIAAVGSEDEIDSNPYVSAILMGIGYLGWEPEFNTRNIKSFSRVSRGGDRVRPRTNDDPEYIPDPVPQWSETNSGNGTRESRSVSNKCPSSIQRNWKWDSSTQTLRSIHG
jgi:hypothetical protein